MLHAEICLDFWMAKTKRLQDVYRFPGFLPQARVRGLFGDPLAVVIRLRRRRKKRSVALVATACSRNCKIDPHNYAMSQQKEGTVAFRQARQNHPVVESAIGALQAGNGLKRCRDRGQRGYERYVALGILGRNLQTLGKLLLAQDEANCLAAQSKRKRKPA